MNRLHVDFVVESGTDIRLVQGLQARAGLRVIARRIPGGRAISQPPAMPLDVVEGPASRAAFARFVARTLARDAGERRVVLVQGYGAAAAAANLVARLRGVPAFMLVCSPVEAYYRCRAAGRTPAFLRQLPLAGLGALARLNAAIGGRYVVLSGHLEAVVRGHGKPPVQVEQVPVYGVDLTIFRPPAEPRERLRARLGLPVSGPILFFSSRIAPEKDADTLLAAVARLRAAGRDARVLHRSGGWRAFLARADGLGLAGAVDAADAVPPFEPLARLYQASDLCVQASREEGLGFSPLESLACETPVVAAAVGGLLETIVAGRTGWSYPAGDDRALANAIAEVLDDPDEARRRTLAGRALVEARFEREAAFDRLIDLLSASVSAAARRAA